jgi:hypothetical protein
MGFYRGPNVVTNGLVLNLDAANTKSYVSGSTTWRNLSGNNYSGSLINGPTFSSANGGSIVFDGVDDYVLINSGSAVLNPTTAITVASFFNITSFTSNYAPIVFKQNNYEGFYEQYSLLLGGTQIYFVSTGVDRQQKIVSSSFGYTNQNIYAVGTCDTVTDELKLYINGNLIQTNTFTSTFDIADTPINIGGTGVLKFGSTYTGWANGRIYNTNIYNRALSASEVAQNYNAQKSRFNLT